MKTRNIQLSALAATALAAAMALVACDQPSRTDSAATTTTPSGTAGELVAKTESAVANVAAATDDAAVTTKVKTALLTEPGLRSLDIHVETREGVVTMSGTADSEITRDRAKEVALGVAGVRSVVDQMNTKS